MVPTPGCSMQSQGSSLCPSPGGIVPALASSTGPQPTFCETAAGCRVALAVPWPTGTRVPMEAAGLTSSCHSGYTVSRSLMGLTLCVWAVSTLAPLTVGAASGAMRPAFGARSVSDVYAGTYG